MEVGAHLHWHCRGSASQRLLYSARTCVANSWPWPAAEAEQPEDWDEDEDGEWEPPKVPNPACEAAPGCGEWKRPLTPNPEYKGKWSAPFIDNPLYKVGVGQDGFVVPVNGQVPGMCCLGLIAY